MSSIGNNTTSKSCYEFSNSQYDLVLRVKFSMDSLGILVCLIVLALIILSKAYKRVVFRLVLYFIIADIFQAITHIIELTPLEHVNGEVVVKEGAEGLCAFYGFLDQIALWMSNVAVIWIMLYLLWIANKLRKAHRDGNPYKNKISIKTELVGLFFLIVFPFTFNWIPFIWNMYGISGLWCWIKESRDYCHDYNFGLSLSLSMFYGPLIIIVTFTFISLIAITIILCKGALNKDGMARKTYTRCIKNTVLIATYPLVYTLICLVLITNRIYSSINGSNGGEPFFPLWVAHTIADPARVLIPPIAFLLHPSSWKTMFGKNADVESFRTASIHIPREDDDIETSIIIQAADSAPQVELYGSIMN